MMETKAIDLMEQLNPVFNNANWLADMYNGLKTIHEGVAVQKRLGDVEGNFSKSMDELDGIIANVFTELSNTNQSFRDMWKHLAETQWNVKKNEHAIKAQKDAHIEYDKRWLQYKQKAEAIESVVAKLYDIEDAVVDNLNASNYDLLLNQRFLMHHNLLRARDHDPHYLNYQTLYNDKVSMRQAALENAQKYVRDHVAGDIANIFNQQNQNLMLQEVNLKDQLRETLEQERSTIAWE